MLAFVLISLLAGMVLGQRFKVLVLLPAIGVALVATIVAGIAGADRWPTVLIAAATVTSLQVGYFSAYGIRRLLAAARANRLRDPSVGRSQAERRGAH